MYSIFELIEILVIDILDGDGKGGWDSSDGKGGWGPGTEGKAGW
jgi:hypothetical protein